MICADCLCPCPISKNGLCLTCRIRARRPQWLTSHHYYAQRWLAPEYRQLRRARGLNPEQAVLLSEFIFRELRKVLPAKTILLWKLDNPYMLKHARRTMVSHVLRSAPACGRKPVQSERHIPARKAVAA